MEDYYVVEEGMYVRTKKGIARITKLEADGNIAYTNKKDIYFGVYRPSGKIDFVLYDDGTVIGKPRFCILNVIEPGDLVNGKIVYQVGYNFLDDMVIKVKEYDEYISFIYPSKIKTIITKDQLEAMAYDVTEEINETRFLSVIRDYN